MAKSKIEVKVNYAAVGELLRGAAMQGDLNARAARVAATAGEGMEVVSAPSGTRARAEVRTATHAARVAEARDRALTRAIDAAR